MNHVALCIVGIAGFLVASGSEAAVPDSIVSGSVLFNFGGSQNLAGFGTVSFAEPRASLTLAAQGAPYPALVANAVVDATGSVALFGEAGGTITYSFQVVGPAGSVPVVASAAGFVSALASSGASFVLKSSWSLVDALAPLTILAGDSIDTPQIGGSFQRDFSDTVALTLTSNHVYVVSMAADVQAAATALDSRVAGQALIDPTFVIGSGVDPGTYTFQFSTGIGNSPPVPEPMPAAMLCAGLLMLQVRLLAARAKRVVG